jgi:adenine phosphoribosyltransferase
MAGGEVVQIGVLLTEGYEWKARLGEDAQLLVGLGHIPMFQRSPEGAWVPIPTTL